MGRYFCDLIFSGLPEFPRLGHEVYSREFHLIPGGAYNAAVALRRLGLDVAWPCAFGNDPFSQYVRGEAEKEDLDPQFFSNHNQPSFHLTAAFSFDRERAFLSYSDPLPPYALADVIHETKPHWIYITHLLLGEELEKLVLAGREAGAKIFMDCQAHHYTVGEEEVQQALKTVDIFSPNRTEAAQLTGEEHMEDMLRVLAKYALVTVIKDGENGSYLIDKEDIVHAPAIKVQVTDTTGAGDNFDSGFLYGLIHDHPLQECLRIGNICGGLSAQGFGGTSTSPTLDMLAKYL